MFPDVIMHRNIVCPLSLVLLSFLTDFFYFAVTLYGLQVKNFSFIFFFSQSLHFYFPECQQAGL